jgi:hypothetical protein
VAIQTNTSQSFIFTGGPNLAPNWQVIDFDAVGAIDGEDINPRDVTPRNVTASGDVSMQNLSVAAAFNGADVSAASVGEALTSDGSGNLLFSSPQAGSEVLRNGSPIEYVALNLSNLPASSGSGDVALLTETSEYRKDNGFPPDTTTANFIGESGFIDFFPSSLVFRPNGSSFYITNNNQFDLAVRQFDISPNFDVQGANSGDLVADINPLGGRGCTGLAFNNDGTKLYELDSGTEVFESNLSQPYEINTRSSTNVSFPLPSGGGRRGLTFNNDGTKFYTTDDNAEKLNQYSMSTPFDITSASFEKDINSHRSFPVDIVFNNDGTGMYELNRDNDKLIEYHLSTPFDIGTETFVNQFNLARSDRQTGMAFNDTNTRFYTIGRNTDEIQEYSIQTSNWDVL